MIGPEEVLDNLKFLIETADERWINHNTPEGTPIFDESDLVVKFEIEKQKMGEETRLAKEIADKAVKEKETLQKQLKEMENKIKSDQVANQIQPLCKICLHNPIDTVIVPCGHRAICMECTNAIGAKCPMCRNEVQMVMRTYDS